MDCAPLDWVVEGAGHAWHAGLGMVALPPLLYEPFAHVRQELPPKPGKHTAGRVVREARLLLVQAQIVYHIMDTAIIASHSQMRALACKPAGVRGQQEAGGR